MARGSSVIDVLIIGDAKKLISATQAADKSMGGLITSGAKALAGLAIIDKGFEFLGTALDDADALADATNRLEGQLGDLAKPLEADAAKFAQIGLSKIAFTEAAASVADWGNAAGVADAQVVNLTESSIDAAVSFSAQDAAGRSTSDALDLMEKAANGSEKAARALGVQLLDGVDPATQMSNIVTQLHEHLGDAASATDDLKGRQAKFQAEFENLTTSIGEAVEGPLSDLLGFINDEIEALPHAIEGFQKLGQVIVDGFATALSPIARVNDALGDLGDTLRGIPFLGDIIGGIFGGQLSQSNVAAAQRAFDERNGQGRP